MRKPTAIFLRVPESLHRLLKEEAEREGVSLNQFCLYVLSKAVGRTGQERSG
jgi:predicted HicB family RNase H-like nuclease